MRKNSRFRRDERYCEFDIASLKSKPAYTNVYMIAKFVEISKPVNETSVSLYFDEFSSILNARVCF